MSMRLSAIAAAVLASRVVASVLPLNLVGVNAYEGPASSAMMPLFVNALRDSRGFQQSDFSTFSTLDSSGWPTGTATYLVLHEGDATAPWIAGVWNASFTAPSTATVQAYDGCSITQSYNAGTGVKSFALTVPSGTASVRIGVTGLTNGLTNFVCYRPGDSAASGTYRADAIAHYGQFGHVRHMWLQSAWYDQTTTTWASRSTLAKGRGAPGYPIGIGYPLEDLIGFSNTLRNGGWFCLPINCTDDYVIGMATMMRDNMDPTLPIYIELANEIWNGSGPLLNASLTISAAYKTAHPGVLDYDGQTNQYYIAQRWKAVRSKEISAIFKSVFGAAAFAARCRVLLVDQDARYDNFYDMLGCVKANYGNPGQFFWGLSTAPYTTPDSTAYGGADYRGSTSTTAQILAALTVINNNIRDASKIEHIRFVGQVFGGLKLIAYEGGPALADGYTQASAAMGAATMDPGMRTVVAALVANCLRIGFDGGFCFFEGGCENGIPVGSLFQARFSLSDDYLKLINKTAPKLLGLLDAIALGVGSPNRNVIAGAGWVLDARNYVQNTTGLTALPTFTIGNHPVGAPFDYTLPYLVWCTAPGNYLVRINYTGTVAGVADLDVNGARITTGVALPIGTAVDATLGTAAFLMGWNAVQFGRGQTYQGAITVNAVKN